ncbi:RNA dependent RNA polymerase [Aspergillus clavatus NRRL 1]|uniref:RNA-dependent RNA polymerase n=1 Tax=Aspergillus clavatus (strain ATCC 1007 / CBS 513.65 / DSM 816 / NCTC 3887 / NRRL 1 / QM 1276 / 107) TaxID=344612 RepID=A1CAB8_ASPCL|nr:RNA-directed RNA polymerase, putative [Aspergillus clavatus NRRL 1]EAW12686.1 RNA-directed RNA polymerase, putative [Aspergillus clavatus NRRL 1]
MVLPRTPVKSGKELFQVIETINEQFQLELPNPQIYSPSVGSNDHSPRWRTYNGLKRLYFNSEVDLARILNDFEEWIASRSTELMDMRGNRAQVSQRQSSAARRQQLMCSTPALVSSHEKEERLRYFMELVDDEIYLLNRGSVRYHPENDRMQISPASALRPLKRRISEQEEEENEEYHTAPNSPVKDPQNAFSRSTNTKKSSHSADGEEDCGVSSSLVVGDSVHVFKNPKLVDRAKEPSKFLEKLAAPDHFRRYDALPNAHTGPNFSFSTVATSFGQRHLDTSFTSTVTDATEPIPDSESMYEDSVVGHMITHELNMSLDDPDITADNQLKEAPSSLEGRIMEELLENGPFSLEQPFPRSIPLRYRYELERVGRSWNVPLNRMLVGNSISFKSYVDFWKWIEGHNQRCGKPLPEKSPSKAWEAATGTLKAERHSEVVFLSGEMDWCTKTEPGILKFRLNPLKIEKTCRFRRRFGSDRFLSLTIPVPARPPRHLRFERHPTLLRESLALWLTQHVHRCLGRIWRPFFVEEVKTKRKPKPAAPKFKVELFAIDGIDFMSSMSRMPSIAPPDQDSEGHTSMSLEALMDWHMPPEDNRNQSNCKLFQRISLGLSKTYATIILKPWQILHLKDVPNRPVMNDGCALMSRGLANAICDSLGITGNTPSCFQGRIAGAKGLWMVDRHQSDISVGGDEFWIQVSDSQLKIHPHPQTWREPVDEEKLTFEVVKWSKPLHSVELNTQLLAILEHGGKLRDYIAQLTRTGIQTVYQDFAKVLDSDSPVLCRSLIQKIKLVADDGSALASQRVKHLEQWTANDTEAIIRLTEAGFAPRSFYPLRKRLGRCLQDVLARYVDELHIKVPLSTYAFCIADPYGVLQENEVHFGFSNNWRDAQGQFEDNLLDGMDVLVGRLPAHVPSDIQRRRAVWKPELRHFKDVIVFPTAGDIPLAHMLSGGDYDGDMPWICWDQNMVQDFRNSGLPTEEFPPEHFGLTKHSVPMMQIQSTDEFLQSAFTFNLTMSKLGRCTVEHEKLSYDESIDSARAKELACLLSHLVDGRKGGVHLSEQAWQQYRKTISPWVREDPAYKNTQRKPKKENIIDYLKFEVALKEKHAVLKEFERVFPENESLYDRDDDLVRPWNEAQREAQIEKQGSDGQLPVVLNYASSKVEAFYRQWINSVLGENSLSLVAREAAEGARNIPPPSFGDHPLIHTWRHSREEWLRLLASYTYQKHSHAAFTIHAFGEVLCQMKASSLPSRSVTNEILACYRVNHKAISQLTAKDTVDEESEDAEEFEGEDAVEAIMYAMHMPGGYDDAEDDMSVE